MSNGNPINLVNNAVEALKGQPAMFALIVICFGLLGYTFYEGASFNSQRYEMTKLIVDYQREMNQLLSKCVVPPSP